MPTSATIYRVLIASTSDIQDEREAATASARYDSSN
jgi:hypothetical protein